MPELPELTVVSEVLHRRLPGQTITAAEAIPPGAAIVLRDLTGQGFGPVLTGARFESVTRRGDMPIPQSPSVTFSMARTVCV